MNSLQKSFLKSGGYALTFLLVVLAHPAHANKNKDKELQVSHPVRIRSLTGELTRAVDINNQGIVVGTYGAPFDMGRSFIWTKKKGFKDIGAFTATAINNCGEISGVANLSDTGFPVNSGNLTNAIIFRDGQIIDLGKLNPASPTSWAWATDINDAGHVSGIAGDQAIGTMTPFLWIPQTGMQALDESKFHSGAYTLNNRDEVAGFKQPDEFNGLQRPALWIPGKPVQLSGGLGGRFGSALAINDRREFVGNSETDLPLFPTRAGFYWSETTGTVPLQPYENDQQIETANEANDINSHGTIVGSISVVTQPGNTEFRAALWTSPSEFFIFSELLSEAVALNDRGQIIGNIFSTNSRLAGAMLWKLKKKPSHHWHSTRSCRYRKIDEQEEDKEDD